MLDNTIPTKSRIEDSSKASDMSRREKVIQLARKRD